MVPPACAKARRPNSRIALELGFGGECGCSEEFESPQYTQGNGDFGVASGVCDADVGVDEFKQVFGIEGDAQGEECADAAQADAEYKMCGCEFVYVVVVVQ